MYNVGHPLAQNQIIGMSSQIPARKNSGRVFEYTILSKQNLFSNKFITNLQTRVGVRLKILNQGQTFYPALRRERPVEAQRPHDLCPQEAG
jgi:hypothetical protein